MSDGRGMNCPACGTELRLVKGRWICPRCDYYKLSYQHEWERHHQNVKALAVEIKERFPQVSLSPGLGADSAEWIDIPPGKKNEPDIEVWLLRKHVLSIEVTGSGKEEFLAKVTIEAEDVIAELAEIDTSANERRRQILKRQEELDALVDEIKSEIGLPD